MVRFQDYPCSFARSAEKWIGIIAGSWNQKFFDDRRGSWLSPGMQTTVKVSVTKVQPKMGCGYVLFVFLLAAGLGLLAIAVKNYAQADNIWTKNSVIPGVFGAALVLGAGAYLKFAKRLVREGREEAERRAQFPGQPWKWKKEWLQPVIEAKTGGSAAAMWVFGVFWNAISLPGAWVVLHDPHPKKGAYFVFLFPLVGLGLLASAIYQTVRWRKFGRVRFVPSTMPGAIGGYLGGVIEVPARVLPEADARLSLKCIRREIRGSGKSSSTTENVLWEHEVRIARDKWVTGLGGTQIPVLFYIPPECGGSDDSDRNNEVLWRLSASAEVPGVDFSTAFVVPVFATGETAPPPEAGHPLLEVYSDEDLDAAALRRCGVRHEGNTFYFSASHLPGTRITTAVLTLGLLGLLGWYWGRGIHPMVWIVTIFFGLILSLFTLDVWCDGFELKIDGEGVEVTKRRPWGTKVTRVARSEVQSVSHQKSMSSGENQYYRLNLIGAAGTNPAGPQAGESFLVRKLRHQLEQLQQQGQVAPEKMYELEREIMTGLRRQPSFTVQFAKHIPGLTKAEAIGAMVLAAIKGSKL